MFSKKIKELRKSSNFTQQKLAEKLNCSLSKIAMLESGKREPTKDDLILLSDIFNVSIDYLLCRNKQSQINTISTPHKYQFKLKDLREENRISLDKLGEILNIQKSTLSRMENNKQDPKSDLINILADYFNVSSDYLLGRTNERNLSTIKNIHLLSNEGLSKLDEYIELLLLKYKK